MEFAYYIFEADINWYSFFRIAGEVAAITFFTVCYFRSSWQVHWQKLVALLLFFAVVGLLGARIFGFLQESLSLGGMAFKWSAISQQLQNGAMRWYGSMLCFIVFLPLLLSIFPKAYRWKLFDLFALSLCLMIVFIKQSCQFAGDGCYGIPTTLPWGIYYSYGSHPSLLPVHPTPLYDSLFHLLFFVSLLRHWKRAAFDGQMGIWFFTGSSAFCFLLEFIRINPTVALSLTLAQWVYLLILLLAILIRLRLSQRLTHQKVPTDSLEQQSVKLPFLFTK